VLAEFGGTYDGVGNPISISKSAESGGTKLDGQRANCEEEHPTELFREHSNSYPTTDSDNKSQQRGRKADHDAGKRALNEQSKKNK